MFTHFRKSLCAVPLVAMVEWACAQPAVWVAPDELARALSAEDRSAIERALPGRASVAARKARRLLVFDRNVNYGGHPSAVHANYAFTLMGRRTEAFEAVVSREPAAFERESLRSFDAVFFNNNVGNLFEDPQLRQNLVEFVLAGGGLLGVHGTAVAFTRWPGAQEDWPEFGLMLGARGANHRINTEHVFIALDDPGHPLNRAFGGRDFEYRDEFFRVHEPYSRQRVRVLFRIDTTRTDMNQGQAYGRVERADRDYALAWVRNYGRGRTFYCTIAHNPYVFRDPVMLRFYCDAIQFAMGDLEAPTIPSARLDPAVRVQEQLGWRLIAEAGASGDTMFETVDRAAALGLCFVSGTAAQAVSGQIPVPLDPALEALRGQEVRFKLDEAGLRLLAYRLPRLPPRLTGARPWLSYARSLGAEVILLDEIPVELQPLDAACAELDLHLVPGWSQQFGPSEVNQWLDRLGSASPRIGFCLDLGALISGKRDPVETVGRMGSRAFVLRLPQRGIEAAGLAANAAALKPWLAAIKAHTRPPLLITLDPSLPNALELREAFDDVLLQLAR